MNIKITLEVISQYLILQIKCLRPFSLFLRYHLHTMSGTLSVRELNIGSEEHCMWQVCSSLSPTWQICFYYHGYTLQTFLSFGCVRKTFCFTSAYKLIGFSLAIIFTAQLCYHEEVTVVECGYTNPWPNLFVAV